MRGVRTAAARRGAAVVPAVVRRLLVLAAGAAAVLRRRVGVARVPVIRRARVAVARVAAGRRTVRRAGTRRGDAGPLNAATSFFSMSASRFSSNLSWADTVLVRAETLSVARTVRPVVVRRAAVVRRAVVLRVAARGAAGLRGVRVAGRAAVRLVPVRLVVRGMSPIPPKLLWRDGGPRREAQDPSSDCRRACRLMWAGLLKRGPAPRGPE